MLTYSSSLNKLITISPLQKIVSAQFAKCFWEAPFKSEEVSNIYDYYAKSWGFQLSKHRKETIIASNTFIEKNNLPPRFKVIFEKSISSLYQAYKANATMEKKTYDPNDEIDLLEENELYAPNYFTVDGEFNDLAWAKRVVLNPNYSIAYRFYLACCYWFENETTILWSELQNSDLGFYNGILRDIPEQMEPLVTLRIIQLGFEPQELPEYEPDFFQTGLEEAAGWEYEYATYYFGQKLTEPEKINITEDDSFFILITGFVDFPHDKVSYFLYSQLSKDRKEKFLDWTVKQSEEWKWLALLLSPYTEAIRSEIIEFVNRLPINCLSHILDDITYKIKTHELPFHEEVLRALLFNLSPEKLHKILMKNFFLLKYVPRNEM